MDAPHARGTAFASHHGVTTPHQTAMPFAPPPSTLPPQVLPAWTPVAFHGLRRRLCQVCGATTQEKNIDNKQHALAHLRAEIARLRFGQGLVPAWGFVADYLFGRAEGRILDDGGRASVAALGRFAPDFIDGFALHMPTLDKPVFTEELKMPATLLWIERSTAEDLISFLPEGKAPATRLHLAHMLDLARLIEAQTPPWLAAMAMNRRHARSVAPAWMLGQWGIDEDPDVRGRLDDTMARLARLESPS